MKCVRCGTQENLYLSLGRTGKRLCRRCTDARDAIHLRRQRTWDQHESLMEKVRGLLEEKRMLEREIADLTKARDATAIRDLDAATEFCRQVIRALEPFCPEAFRRSDGKPHSDTVGAMDAIWKLIADCATHKAELDAVRTDAILLRQQISTLEGGTQGDLPTKAQEAP